MTTMSAKTRHGEKFFSPPDLCGLCAWHSLTKTYRMDLFNAINGQAISRDHEGDSNLIVEIPNAPSAQFM